MSQVTNPNFKGFYPTYVNKNNNSLHEVIGYQMVVMRCANSICDENASTPSAFFIEELFF